MPTIEIRKDSQGESIPLRIVDDTTVEPLALTADAPGLDLWYRREGEQTVHIALTDLDAETSPWSAGGFIALEDGYHRLDLPDEALADGTTRVLVGGTADGAVVLGLIIKLTERACCGTIGPGVPFDPNQYADCNLFLPESDAPLHDGCPVLTKRRHVPVQKGVCGTVLWTMRLPNGQPADLDNCLTAAVTSVSESESITEETLVDEVIKVRFQGCDRGPILAEVDGLIESPESGLVSFPLPEAVCQNAGLYQFQAALMRGGAPVFIHGGLVSVEHGMWGNTAQTSGPPTIQEIRFHLKDLPEENTLLGEAEFDDAEILEAIRWPVMEFNETPPEIRRFNCNTFPYRRFWLNAIVARLLKTAAHHYVRNKLKAVGTGLSVDSKARDDDYLRIAKMYDDEWKLFIREKKVELNMRSAWGTLY